MSVAYAREARALQLDWQAPIGCPTSDAILRDIKRLAGASQGDALEARAIVTQTPDQRWRVVIDLSGAATGHRALTADSCAQLARATALIVGLAANPDAALDLPADDLSSHDKPMQPDVPVSPQSTAPAGAVTPPSEHTNEDPPPPKPRMDVPVELLARVGLERGSMPTSTGWLGIGGRMRSLGDPISLDLTAHVTQTTSATFTNGVGATFRVVAAQARVCLDSKSERWRVSGCSGMQLALLRASGYVEGAILQSGEYTDAVTFTRYRWIPGPLLGLNFGYAFASAYRVELGADLIIPTTRWQFVVENIAPLFRPADLQALFYLGISYGSP